MADMFAGLGLFGLDPLGFMIVAVLFMIGIFVLMLFLFERSKNGKAIIMNYITENLVNFMDRKVDDGSILIGKKQIHVDKVEPITVRTGRLMRTHRPLYVIKWNLALPLRHSREGIKVVTGENLKHLVENKTLEQLLKPKGSDGKVWLYLVLGIVLGIMAGYIISGMMAKPA